MGKRIFWIFILSIVAATATAVIYVQSESFARFAKKNIQSHVRKLGLEISFDRLKIGVLPPSLSLMNVSVEVVNKSNQLGLNTDAILKAERVGFSFRMIQAFSSGIAINKVFINDGQIEFLLPKSRDEKGEKFSELVHRPIQIQISDQFFASIRQLELRNTKIDLTWREREEYSNLKVANIAYLAVTPAESGTNIVVNLEEISLKTPKLNESFRTLKGSADLEKSRILISTLDMQRKDAAFHAAGKLIGSIDTIEESRPDIDLILRSPFSELADFEKSFSSLKGDLIADIKVVGKLRDPAIQGKLEVSNLEHSLWKIEKIEAIGSYASDLIVLDSLSATAGGGMISVDNKIDVSFPIKSHTKNFKIKLTDADFHDFAGDLKKDVNNLNFRADGNVNVGVDLNVADGKVRLSAVKLEPKLEIKSLELNNQTYAKKREYKKIFKLNPFNLSGTLSWRQSQKELKVADVRATFATGSLDIKGVVSEEKGFDLVATTSEIDVGSEVGDISGQALTGKGSLKVLVEGPSDAVRINFLTKTSGARFSDFNLGEIDGAIVYDDGKSFIFLSGLRGRKNSADYEINGSVNVGEGDDISLDASFQWSDPNDLFQIFESQLKEISWIPHGITGRVKGNAKIRGGYSDGLHSLDIESNVTGQNFSYKGEMVHEVEAFAGLKNSVAFAKRVRAKKYESIITGEIDYNLKNDDMAYSIRAEKAKLRALDFFTAYNLPVDGLFDFNSQGKGKWETIESQSKFSVDKAYIRTRALPPIVLNFETFRDRSKFLLNIGSDLDLAVEMSSEQRGKSTAAVRAANAELDYLLCAISKSNCLDPSLSLALSGEAKLEWNGNQWKSMKGSGAISELSLSRSGFHNRISSPATISVSNGLASSSEIKIEGENTSFQLALKGNVDGSSIDNSIKGTASLRLLEIFTPLITEGRGKMKLNTSLVGSLTDANFGGNIIIEDGFLRIHGLDAPVDGLNAKLRFSNYKLMIESLLGQLGGGTVQATGGMDLYLNKPPRFNIELFLANNRLKFYPVNYAEFSDAKLTFTGDSPPYLFSGTARVKKVLMRNNFDLGQSQKGLQNARYLPEKVGGAKSFYEVRIRAVAESGILVENNLLNAEFRGELTLLNNFEFPQILARAELVRGKLLFRNTAFTLDHAYIRAPNPAYFNPQFSIGGVSNLDNYRINIFASGTIDKPKISLSSYPAIPQEDIVSLLAFGYRGEEAKNINSNDKSAITYSEVGSILLEQLQLSQNLQQKGLRVAVVPSINQSEANIIRPNDTSAAAAPKVYVQSQIVKNLEAAFGGTVGATQGQAVDAKLEYRLGRKASVSAVYEQSSSPDAAETRNSYGADLKFRWGFK